MCTELPPSRQDSAPVSTSLSRVLCDVHACPFSYFFGRILDRCSHHALLHLVTVFFEIYHPRHPLSTMCIRQFLPELKTSLFCGLVRIPFPFQPRKSFSLYLRYVFYLWKLRIFFFCHLQLVVAVFYLSELLIFPSLFRDLEIVVSFLFLPRIFSVSIFLSVSYLLMTRLSFSYVLHSVSFLCFLRKFSFLLLEIMVCGFLPFSASEFCILG